MKENDILKICHFYKGENIIPDIFIGQAEGKLWRAEQFACEYPDMFDGYENLEKRMAEIVCMYVSKWDIYDKTNTLKVYFEKSTYKEDFKFYL